MPDNNDKLYGTEETEEFYSALYEFDDSVRKMITLIKDVNRREMSMEDQNLLNHYDMLLRELAKTYAVIDKILSTKIQNRSS